MRFIDHGQDVYSSDAELQALETEVQGIKENLTVLYDRKIYKVSTTFSRLSNGYATKDLGSDFGDNGTYYCIGATGIISANAQVVAACAIQEGRYIRITMTWNGAYTNSDIWLTYYYVKRSSLTNG